MQIFFFPPFFFPFIFSFFFFSNAFHLKAAELPEPWEREGKGLGGRGSAFLSARPDFLMRVRI